MTRLRKGSKRLAERAPVTRDALVAQIDEVLGVLAAPMDEKELAAGWSSPRAAHIRDILFEVKAKLLGHEGIPYTPLVRWADHLSITSGQTLDALAAIDVGLNEQKW
jgi:hypothetical protein